tara:strand:- start:264 stop:515 length:252 start_codon:yes stop_codon:yes gene_type:complete
MLLSAELTLYPLKDDYLEAIKDTIAKLNTFEGIKVQTFPSATIVMGEYDSVMNLINTIVKWSYETHGRCVFLVKFLPEYEALA